MGKTYHFTHVSGTDDCGVVFYDRKTKHEIARMDFPKESRIGRRYFASRCFENGEDVLYQFREGESRMPDPKGKAFFSAKKYGEAKSVADVFTVLDIPEFDWNGSQSPMIPYENCLIYCLHLRGFTKHVSSGVKARGTFGGVVEKISYLKSLGVTTLEFQPIYEYIEKKTAVDLNGHGMQANGIQPEPPRLNYWGYAMGYYLAPKEAYAVKNAVTECKEMIRALHEAGMEAVLQFYFPKEFNPMLIPEILRFWVEEYHVDGFHLIGENLPADLIARDPELSDVKLWYYQFDAEAIYGKRGVPEKRNLGLLRDDFMYEARRFLKGDENLVPALMHRLRALPAAIGQINYLTTYWGFTLMDAVSYDFKHNEPNGEDNHDGTDYNCSWNCGEEGPSRKKKIRSLRIRQIKNAFCILLFAQGTPRIFMGDEFGNSQKGNNNPYCQDNEVTWLNWNLLKSNFEIFEFFVRLLSIRRANPILHPAKEAQMMDSISCGYPDLSFHGETAWRPQTESYSRQLGVAYCGLYQEKDLGISLSSDDKITKETVEDRGTTEKEDFLYLAMNMHWEGHKLGLPRLPKGKRWELKLSTNEEIMAGSNEEVKDHAWLPPKTIALYVGRDRHPEDEEDLNVSEPK